MRRRIISYQKAAAICKAEDLDFSKIKEEGPYLLKTGAKLSRGYTGICIICGDSESYVPFEYGIEIKTRDMLALKLVRTGLVDYDGEKLVIWVPSSFKDPERYARRAAYRVNGQVVRR